MRKQKEITLQDGDRALTFVITQMSARQQQLFILEVLSLISPKSGENMNMSDLQSLSSVNIFGLLHNIDIAKSEKLINQLYTCVKQKVDNALVQVSEKTVDGIIEELPTLFSLQKEVISVNFSFLQDVKTSNLASEPKGTASFNMRM